MITIYHVASRLCHQLAMLSLRSWLVLSILCPASRAQIILDGSLGSQGPLVGPDYTIPARLGQIYGHTLFHSFGMFNIRTGESATFTGPHAIDNILSRVTGGQRSLIDGTLRSEIPGANLYLLNPAGVLFGPNATLDVKGSFHVSTADAIWLRDGGVFHAHLAEQSVLTVAPPAAFGFLRPNPAAIRLQGSALTVPEGKTVSIIGGNVTMRGGTITAPGGQSHLVSVASPGEVEFAPPGQRPTLTVNTVERFGTVTLSDAALIDVSGARGGAITLRSGHLRLDQSRMRADTQGERNGARVGVDIDVTDTVTLINRSFITAQALGAGDAGAIRLEAEHVRINESAVSARADIAVRGRMGKITLDVGTLTLTHGGVVENIGFGGPGKRGTIIIRATDSVTITGQASSSFPSGIFSSGINRTGGRVVVKAPVVRLTDGGVITTVTGGGSARGGEIVINAGTLTIRGESGLTSSSTGAGRAGTVIVRAMDSVIIAGQGGGLFSAALGGGGAGSIILRAPTVRLTDGGMISVKTRGEGQGGEIVLKTGQLSLSGGARIDSSTQGTQPGGRVTVTAWDTVTILGQGSGLFSETAGGGEAGRIRLRAPRVHLADGGSISTMTSEDSRAGDIVVRAGTLRLMDGGRIDSSSVGTTVTSGSGGDIALTARTVQLADGALISVAAAGPGNAGHITIPARETVQSTNSALTTTANAGRGGTITIRANRAMSLTATDISATVTGGSQPGGSITLTTPALTVRGGQVAAETQGNGRAGNITLAVGTLTAQGATLSSSSAEAAIGDAGTVTIHGVAGAGTPATTVRLTDSTLQTRAEGTGAGGAITIAASESLTLQNTTLSATVNNGADTPGKSRADMTLRAPTLTLLGAHLEAETTGTRSAGSILLAAETVVAQETAITSSSTGTAAGNAGTITIRGLRGPATVAENVTLTRSRVATEATAADGGDIQIQARDIVWLRESQLTTAVRSGEGRGGNVRIDAGFVILDQSQMQADAFGGPGGNVRIVAHKAFLADPNSRVSASSALGIDGLVNIQAPVANISESVAALPQTFARAPEVLYERCAARLWEGQVSTLIARGTEGLPPRPGGVLPSWLSNIQGSPVHPGEVQESLGPEGVPSRPGELRLDDNQHLRVSPPPVEVFSPVVRNLECPKW
jgi:filamentous hemagglutinin family protein